MDAHNHPILIGITQILCGWGDVGILLPSPLPGVDARSVTYAWLSSTTPEWLRSKRRHETRNGSARLNILDPFKDNALLPRGTLIIICLDQRSKMPPFRHSPLREIPGLILDVADVFLTTPCHNTRTGCSVLHVKSAIYV